jgi:hypothetical protein
MPLEDDKIEKAFSQWKDALQAITAGNLLSHSVNDTFDMLTKALWKTPKQSLLKQELHKVLEHLSGQFSRLEHPAPMLLTIISLKDREMDIAVQEMVLFDWIKRNGDEQSTFQLINILDTFERRGTHIEPLVKVLIKNINDRMEPEMLKALGFWLTNDREEYLGALLRKFAELKDRSVLKEFSQMAGRRAVLELMEFMRPGEVKKVLSAKKEKPEEKGPETFPWKAEPLTDEEKAFKERLGLCYELAYKFIKNHPEAKLIHGSIRGSGEEKRIRHAWVEVGDKIFDPVMNKMVPKWLYEEQFNAQPEKIYTHEEALISLVKNRHYGPWA